MKINRDDTNQLHQFDQFAGLIKRLETDEVRPFAPNPKPQFKKDLYQSLMEQHEKARSRWDITRLWQFASSAIALLILAVSIATVWFAIASQQSQTFENEAEVVVVPQRDRVIHDVLALQWVDRNGTAVNLQAESWQTINDNVFRGQVTDLDGNLVYFVQSDGTQLWRTYQADPDIGWGTTPITTVYQTTLPNDTPPQSTVPLWVTKSPFFSGLNWEWVPSAMLQRKPDCQDILCVLQQIYPEPEATCTLTECVFYGGAFTRTVENLGSEMMEDGRTIMTLIIGTERVIKIDADSLTLIEVSEAGNTSANQPRSIAHIDRQTISAASLPPDFFSTLPDSLQSEPWHPDAAYDDVWLISATPEPGSLIADQLDTSIIFTLEIGYDLATAPEALLQVELVPQSALASGAYQETAVTSPWIPISAAVQSVTVEMQAPPIQPNADQPILVPIVTLILREPKTAYGFYREPMVESAWILIDNGATIQPQPPMTLSNGDEDIDQLTIVDYSPETSTQFSGTNPIQFNVTLSYRLESVPTAEIHVYMMPGNGGTSLLTAVTPITAGTGEITIPFTFNPRTDLGSSESEWMMNIQLFSNTEEGLVGLAGASPHTSLEDSWHFEP